jgi:hypothetical protein
LLTEVCWEVLVFVQGPVIFPQVGTKMLTTVS